ncbi:Trafficking protein particle complex subunit 8 [Acipenser ruthenus]|uniref:Trafficking protein particle complex subunit 8 n=1 Tax=Acipenser ruthenus TaxID=7906 RepID=A0A444UM86_ACIRT|nr:Trafficking protein particle complex subunit 8 [Acipenser ruthenus]
MAQCLQSVQEFIQDSFVPMVAVLCSEDAEQVTRKNNLNFSELVRPFCRLTSEGHMRDPNNQIQVIKNLKIHVSNIVTQPPHLAAIRKMLSEVVSVSQPAEGLVANVITAGDYDLNISVSSNEPQPVEQFLKLSQEQHRIQHSSDYTYPKWFTPNTLKYYVLLHDISEVEEQRADTVYEEMKQRYGTQGCYLLKINSRTSAISTDEQIPDPWSQYLQKSNLQNQELYEDGTSVVIGSTNTENNVSEPEVDGIDPSVKADGVPNNFKTHPLQLDHPSDPGGSFDALDTLRNAVQITDGKKPSTVTTHGACLTLNDHDRIRQFIQEFTFRGLLPHIEKSIRQLNDQLVSRKGLSRSLFSATKKWFSGGKVPEKSIAELKNTAGLLYPPEAPELQIRKLADLCFLVQHYDLAYNCYHTAKKDFLNDQAMLYAAGALEMAAVSAFLQPGAPRPYPAHYMDTAIQTYRDVCKNMVLAERCALLSAEILKSQVKCSEAATLLIRMTSEDSDLRSALLLEQAAHCFINMRSPMARKFAFHMILAGHRFSKAGQNVSQLSPDDPLPQLPLPCIQSSATRVFFGHDRRLAEGQKQAATHVSLDQEFDCELSQQWKELEEQVVAVVNRGAIPVNFQPTQYCLNSQTDNLRFPLAVVQEPIIVEVVFKNPLKVPLLLTDLSLLWKFQSKVFGQLQNGDEPISNEKEAHVKATFKNEIVSTEVILEFSMSSEETKVARLKLLPHQTGELHILGVVYNLETVPSVNVVDGTDPSGVQGEGNLVINGMSVRGRQDLEIQGPRLNNTKEEKTSVKHGPDRRLDPIITPPMPLLEVFFINFPTGLLCGEIRKAFVEFVNVSKVPLAGLKVASKHPEFFTFGSNTAALTPQSPTASENCSAYKTIVTDSTSACTALTSLVSPVDFGMGSGNSSLGVIDIPLPDSVLLPGASIQLPLWLRGPDKEGVHEIQFLFYYESPNKLSKLSHRVLRHTAVICTSRSLSVRATVCRSNTFQDEEDGRNGNMLVFVDVENINTNEAGVREFHIVQVSSSSKKWRFQKCINPSEDKDAKLTSRERGKLCFKATTCKYQEATSGALGKYTFADIILGNEQIISATTPCADFFFRSCHSSESKKTLTNGYTSFVPARWPTDDVGKVVRKCSEIDLNIIVLWKAYVVEDNKQLILEGQLHVTLQTIGKEAYSLSQKQEAQEMVLLKLIRPEQPPLPARPSVEQLSHLIKTSLHYPESYDHPFLHKSLCVVPVTLMLSNCSQAGVDVIIDLRHKAISPETLEVHGSFTWLGQTQFKLQLKAQEIHKLQLKACFIHAGVYNLGTPRVFAKLTDQGSMCETSQQNSMPALIIINNI